MASSGRRPWASAFSVMTLESPIKSVLKRGALLAAANWQVTLIQFVAEWAFKLLLSVPLVGGLLLGALVVGQELPALGSVDLRAVIDYIASTLLAEPTVLGAFLVSLAIVGLPGSALMFLIKGGTVTVLLAAERAGVAVEDPPLRLQVFWSGAAYSLGRFRDGCLRLFRRYLRLGLLLILVYVASAIAYLMALFGAGPAPAARSDVGWTMTAGAVSLLLVAWITIVNFIYLLVQLIVAAENCSVRVAAVRAGRFLWRCRAPVLSVFGIVVVLVMTASVVSFIATAALGVIAFVPLAGLAVVPLQLLAWLFRGLVFQFIGLSALSSYLSLYRRYTEAASDVAAADPDMPVFSEG
ncbi:MAG: hypothetical protein AB1806_08875 [Acidobacteriota bacterium]